MCILLVDHEPLIRAVLAEEFTKAGSEVREAETGDGAAAMFEVTPLDFTLLVTDIHVPGTLDGIELARRVRARRPDLPIIYMTGRPDPLDSVEHLGDSDVRVAKPFAPSPLLTVVRRLLGAGGGRAH